MKALSSIFALFVVLLLGYIGYSFIVKPPKVELKPWDDPAVSAIEMNVDINYDAPVVERQEIYIKADRREIWQKIAHVNDWPVWQSSVTSAELTSDPTEKTEFHWVAGWIKFRSRFHTLKKFSAIGWTGTTYGTDAVHNWRLEPKDDGCMVYVEESLDGWLPLLMTSNFREELNSGMKKNLQELKAACEK